MYRHKQILVINSWRICAAENHSERWMWLGRVSITFPPWQIIWSRMQCMRCLLCRICFSVCIYIKREETFFGMSERHSCEFFGTEILRRWLSISANVQTSSLTATSLAAASATIMNWSKPSRLNANSSSLLRTTNCSH